MSEQQLALAFRHVDGYSVVTFPAELTDANLTEAQQAFQSVVGQLETHRFADCIVDLSALNHMGSALVATVVRIWKKIKDNGRFAVVAPTEGVNEVLTAAGLTKVLTVVESFESALHELGYSREAKVEKRETRMMTMVGPLTLIAAAAGLASELLPLTADYRQETRWVVLALSGIALLAGTISAAREQGVARIVSVVVCLLSVAILGAVGWTSFVGNAISP